MNEEKRKELDLLTYRYLKSINDFTNTYTKTSKQIDKNEIVYSIHTLSEELSKEYYDIIKQIIINLYMFYSTSLIKGCRIKQKQLCN